MFAFCVSYECFMSNKSLLSKEKLVIPKGNFRKGNYYQLTFEAYNILFTSTTVLKKQLLKGKSIFETRLYQATRKKGYCHLTNWHEGYRNIQPPIKLCPPLSCHPTSEKKKRKNKKKVLRTSTNGLDIYNFEVKTLKLCRTRDFDMDLPSVNTMCQRLTYIGRSCTLVETKF